jgi:hypothetical protein
VYNSLEVCEHRYWGFWHFMNTSCGTIVSAFCDWFQQTRMTPWLVSWLPPPLPPPLSQVLYWSALIAFMLCNSFVEILFCIIVLKLTVLLMLNMGECLLVIISVPVYWSLIVHHVECLVFCVVCHLYGMRLSFSHLMYLYFMPTKVFVFY